MTPATPADPVSSGVGVVEDTGPRIGVHSLTMEAQMDTNLERTRNAINERLDFERIRAIAEDAASAAVRSVQDDLGIEGDGIASIHFNDETWSLLRSIMQEYAEAEVNSEWNEEEGGEA